MGKPPKRKEDKKLFDGGGGFFIEDEERAGDTVAESLPPPLMPPDKPNVRSVENLLQLLICSAPLTTPPVTNARRWKKMDRTS